MSLEALTQTLTQQAEQTAAEERERTAREIDQILSNARRERDQRRDATRAQLEYEYRGEMRARLAQARRKARQSVLQSRASLIARVFECVRSELAGLEKRPELVSVVPELLREALQFVTDEQVEVRCPPTLVDVIEKLTSSRPEIAVVEDVDLSAGLSIRTLSGSVTIDNTMQARLERMQDDLAIDILRRFDQTECHTGVT